MKILNILFIGCFWFGLCLSEALLFNCEKFKEHISPPNDLGDEYKIFKDFTFSCEKQMTVRLIP